MTKKTEKPQKKVRRAASANKQNEIDEKAVAKTLSEWNEKLKSFRGNPLLKRTGEKIEVTPENLVEYKKCMEDPVYFAEKYVKIVHVDKGLIPITLYPYQKKILKALDENRFNIVLSCRQSGKTTISVCFLLHYILFHSDKRCACLANKGRTALMIVGRIELAYMHLPKWLQQGVVEWAKTSFSLENGSSITGAASSSDSIRGESFSLLYQDEAAFVPPNVWEDFYRSTYPTISSGSDTKYIMVSTFNGQNHFYDIWQLAIAGKSLFHPTRVDWWDVPGRDEKWHQDQLKQMTEQDFAQEYGNEPLGTSNTLFDNRCYIKLSSMIIPPIQSTSEVKIYREPIHGHQYVAACDVADCGGDYSTINIVDVTGFPYEQVAVYHSNQISYLQFPIVIIQLATKYNKADVAVESNEIGHSVLHMLNYTYEYENLVATRIGNQIKLGLRTTTKSKMLGCNNLKELVATNKLVIHDKATYDESKHFVVHKGSYAASPGKHDDLIMGLVVFSYYASMPIFKYKYDKNFIDENMKTYEEETEEQLLPLPIFSENLMRERERVQQMNKFFGNDYI